MKREAPLTPAKYFAELANSMPIGEGEHDLDDVEINEFDLEYASKNAKGYVSLMRFILQQGPQ